MPKAIFGRDYEFLPREQLLSFEEIARVARILVDQGVEKIRLTGGEPLLRTDIEQLIEMLARLDVEVTLTTNGTLLARKAEQLASAGLSRVTVSLDSLDDEVFRQMNDVDFPVERVLEAIRAADEAGLGPIKVNAVVKRGVNDHTVGDMASHFHATGVVVRFIEYMDVGHTNGWRLDDVVPAAEIVEAVTARHSAEPIQPNYPGEVANRFRYLDGGGEFGVIASVSQPFCGACTRLRLSADGQVFTCLFGTDGHDLLGRLRRGDDDAQIEEFLRRIWQRRDDRYSEIRSDETENLERVEMSYIGG